MPELNKAEIGALQEALDDEYRAWAIYNQVIHDFGEVRPFTNILGAEERHIDALHSLFVRYGLAVPNNSWPEKVPHYASIKEACEAGVAAEIANGALYERLLGATRREDILRVFFATYVTRRSSVTCQLFSAVHSAPLMAAEDMVRCGSDAEGTARELHSGEGRRRFSRYHASAVRKSAAAYRRSHRSRAGRGAARQLLHRTLFGATTGVDRRQDWSA
jgi:hypothetical protein